MLEIPNPAQQFKCEEKSRSKQRRKVKKERECRECSAWFDAQRATREFCSTRCRQAFHNRAATRGAEFYHLWMAIRFDRAAAKEAGALSLMCRMASAFKEDDRRRQARRPSWDAAAKVKARNVQFVSTVVDANAAGRRR